MGGGGGGFKVDYNPAKTNLQDHARLCKNLACKTCLAHARDMSLFLHDSCTILHISCKKSVVQDFARDAARIITCKFAQFFARSCKNWCKIVQESCKKRDISRARAKQVLHARFLHNLA